MAGMSIRCAVCRERMRPGETYYEVDSRRFCPDCAEIYKQSHYPEMTYEQFRRLHEYTVQFNERISATA